MKRKYELTDRQGRYIEAFLDTEKDLFKFTMYLSVAIRKEEDIRDVFNKLGFTVMSQQSVAPPQVIDLQKEREKRK